MKKNVPIRIHGSNSDHCIGFTLLYFKMTMMPLVPETKMADVGILISLGNLLVRKVTWFVLTTTSATWILSRDFGADCMTRIAYIYSCLSRTHSFHFNNTLSYIATYKNNSLSPFWLTETTHTHTLPYILTSSTQPHENVYSPQPFSFLSGLFGMTCYSIEHNHRNFTKPPKETNNQHGRRHVPPNIHN